MAKRMEWVGRSSFRTKEYQVWLNFTRHKLAMSLQKPIADRQLVLLERNIRALSWLRSLGGDLGSIRVSASYKNMFEARLPYNLDLDVVSRYLSWNILRVRCQEDTDDTDRIVINSQFSIGVLNVLPGASLESDQSTFSKI
ncbi:hypothetical protein Tco_0100010 [Tanacetum coccineum]|uniref:Uncharacterized protein n=1 Tax=Tanacetum coccineum TaxID=301880 RepID=A0ABQ5EJQ7_9ASTR